MRITQLLIELTRTLEMHGNLEVEVVFQKDTYPIIGLPEVIVRTDKNNITKEVVVI